MRTFWDQLRSLQSYFEPLNNFSLAGIIRVEIGAIVLEVNRCIKNAGQASYSKFLQLRSLKKFPQFF